MNQRSIRKIFRNIMFIGVHIFYGGTESVTYRPKNTPTNRWSPAPLPLFL